MISEKMIDDYISDLKVFDSLDLAILELDRYREMGKYNYEVLTVPQTNNKYVVCESKGWELLSRRGYEFAKY
jgi:hypothetical protein